MTVVVAAAVALGFAQAATFTVDSAADSTDASPGNGVCADSSGNCTLRAALEESHVLPGTDTVSLGALGSIALSLGPLVVTQSVTIQGAGAEAVTLDAAGGGRVLEVSGQGTVLVLRGATLRGGSTGADGGGVHVGAGSVVILDGVHVRDNLASGDGGGIFVDTDASLTVSDSVLRGNRALRGGGFAAAGTAQVSGTWLEANTAVSDGGGFWVAATFAVTDSTASSNMAGGAGGGAYFAAAATGSLFNTTFAENVADTAAGIAVSGYVRVEHMTVSANVATTVVGGVDVVTGATILARNVLMSHNVHAAAVPSDVRCDGGKVATEGGNWIQAVFTISGTCMVTGAVSQDTSGVWYEPLTAPAPYWDLSFHPPVMLLAATSPAIDIAVAGCTAYDARGVARPLDGDVDGMARCDAGAVEVQPSADVALTLAVTSQIVEAPTPLPITMTVRNEGPFPTTDTLLWLGLPSGLTFAAATSGVGCGAAAGLVTCMLGRLDAAAEMTVVVTAATNGAGALTITAAVTHGVSDPDLDDLQATATVTVETAADLGVVLVPGEVEVVAGTPVALAVTVSNAGPMPVTSGGVTLSLPAGLVVDAADGCESGAGILTCADAIAVGTERTWHLTLRPEIGGTFRVDAEVFGDVDDPMAANNTARTTIVATLATDPPTFPSGVGVVFTAAEITSAAAIEGIAVAVLGVRATAADDLTEPVAIKRLVLTQASVGGAYAALGDIVIFADDGSGTFDAADAEVGRGVLAHSRAQLLVELSPASQLSPGARTHLWIAVEPPVETAALLPLGGATLLAAGLLGVAGAPRRRQRLALLIAIVLALPACGSSGGQGDANDNVPVVLSLDSALVQGVESGATYATEGLPLVSGEVTLP